jgi:hypothetical protein
MRIKLDAVDPSMNLKKAPVVALDVANRERHHFEATISTLAQSTVGLTETRRAENLKTLKENMLLIR